MYLIQILLPRTTDEDDRADDTAFARTREELVAKFTGVTAYMRAPAQGLWTAPGGRVERDEMVMIEVLTENLDRAWWRQYGVELARRFRQKEIHIRALPAESL